MPAVCGAALVREHANQLVLACRRGVADGRHRSIGMALSQAALLGLLGTAPLGKDSACCPASQ